MYDYPNGDYAAHGVTQWETTLQCNVVSHWLSPCTEWVKTSRPKQNGRHFSDDISELYFTKETSNLRIFVPKGPIDNRSPLGSWCGTMLATRHWLLTNDSRWHSFDGSFHYNGVIMGAMASQITSLTIVYSTVYSDQRKLRSAASPAFVRGIHRWPVNSPHKWPVNAENVSIWWLHHALEAPNIPIIKNAF